MKPVKIDFFHASPHRSSTSWRGSAWTEHKRTNAGWVLLLSRDTRAKIHTLLGRYAAEIRSSVNREGCNLWANLRTSRLNLRIVHGTAENPDFGWIGGRELGELCALKTESPAR